MVNTLSKDSTESDEQLLASSEVGEAYSEHAVGLERFLLGILKDDAATADALQATFIKLMEKGHSVQKQSSLKSWLFRVAFNEAMLIRRKQAIGRKHSEAIAWKQESRLQEGIGGKLGQPVKSLLQQEEIELVRAALSELSDVQREVVEKRIYEGLKFREIADELDVPLGTVLARMQSSLKKLKPILIAYTETEP